jgi:ankyrin repeat protein
MALCSVQMSSLCDMINDWDGGSIEGICSFIEKHPESMSRTDFIGRTPLRVAIQSHRPLPLIKFLVEKRPDALGEAGRKGELPIHMAARAGCPVATVKLLLKYRPGSIKERCTAPPKAGRLCRCSNFWSTSVPSRSGRRRSALGDSRCTWRCSSAG